MQQPDTGIGDLERAGDGVGDRHERHDPTQAALMRRLTDRNSGVCQYWRGTVSRAYCSVNGITGSSRKITSARTAAAMAPSIFGERRVEPGRRHREDGQAQEHHGAGELEHLRRLPAAHRADDQPERDQEGEHRGGADRPGPTRVATNENTIQGTKPVRTFVIDMGPSVGPAGPETSANTLRCRRRVEPEMRNPNGLVNITER